MFKSAAELDRQRTAASFDKALARYGESAEKWFDGSVGSIDRRLGACDRLLYSAHATVARLAITDARRYLRAAAALNSDRRALFALRDDLLTGASSRADVVGPPGWRTASDDDDDDDDRPTVPPKDEDFETTINEKQKSRIENDGDYGSDEEVDTNTGDGSDSEGKQRRSATIPAPPEAGYELRMPYPPVHMNEGLKGPYQNAIDNEEDPFKAIQPRLGGLDRRWVDLESARFVAANTDALDDNHELATRAHEYAAAKTSTFTPARSAAICERFVARVATLGRRAYRPAVVRTAAYQDFDDQAIYLC